MKGKKQHITILGGGESGTGAALLAQQEGHIPFVSDSGPIQQGFTKELNDAGIQWEAEGHSTNSILKSDLVIKSPGISWKAGIVKTLKEKGTPVKGEVEYAGQFIQGEKIGITGTNGKTTTAQMTYQILKDAGKDVALAGNIGPSLSRKLTERKDFATWVIELSSFQLEDLVHFKNDIAVLLNITEDHMNRYEQDFSKYVEAKFRITKNQSSKDYFIYNHDDPVITSHLENYPVQAITLPFSQTNQLEKGAWLANNTFYIKTEKEAKGITMTTADTALKGKHNKANTMAASVVGRIKGIRNPQIRESLQGMKSVEHRLESVLTVHGMEFINDSKGSNINATWFALETTPAPIVWIAGGYDKGNDYSSLKPLARDKVKLLICLGKDNTRFISEFETEVPMVLSTDNMKDAVKMAYANGKDGDTILLSPACASFDLFEDFTDRGRQFKQAVYEL